MRRLSHLTLCSLLTLLVLVPPTAEAASPKPGPRVGTNLAFLTPTSGELPFVDLFKTSSPWIPGQRNGCFGCSAAGTLELTPEGWVEELDDSVGSGGQVAHTFIYLDLSDDPGLPGNRFPAGAYTVLYDGEGVLDYDGAASKNFAASDPNGGYDVVDVDPSVSHLFSITLLETDDQFPITNIRVLPPGGACSNADAQFCTADAECGTGNTCQLFVDHSATQIFDPRFLANVQDYEVLRMMDWMQTIESTAVGVADWTTLSSARWNPAPPEIMARLANRIGADLWVNVPHLASTALIDHLADRLHAELDSQLDVYVEYSNEVWNSNFGQFWDITNAGCAAYTDLTDCADDADTSNPDLCEGHPWQAWNDDCEAARSRYQADRSRFVWERFALEFNDPVQNIDRVVRVLASQSGNSDKHGPLLAWSDTYAFTDVLATGAYFGYMLGDSTTFNTWKQAVETAQNALADEQDLCDELALHHLPDTIADMSWDHDWLALQGSGYSHIELVFYEGGQGLEPWDDPQQANTMTNAFRDVNRDDCMGNLYDTLLSAFVSDGGGTLFLHYVNTHDPKPWGSYGALEYRDQPKASAPKYQALMDFIDNLTP